jgi:hypothetical protein
VDRARHGGPAGRLVRDRVLAAAAGPVLSGRAASREESEREELS